MSKVTTEDCRKFLADWFKNDASLIANMFADDYVTPPVDLMVEITNPKNWKRKRKFKPGGEECFSSNGYFMVYRPGQPVNRWGETDYEEPIENFSWVREFICDNTDGQVGYVVLERHDGTIALGQYCGD